MKLKYRFFLFMQRFLIDKRRMIISVLAIIPWFVGLILMATHRCLWTEIIAATGTAFTIFVYLLIALYDSVDYQIRHPVDDEQFEVRKIIYSKKPLW